MQYQVEQTELDLVRTLLAGYPHATHVQVVARGDTLALVSGKKPDVQKHARLTRLGKSCWAISLPRHTGAWEKTPFMGPLPDMVRMIAVDLALFLDRP